MAKPATQANTTPATNIPETAIHPATGMTETPAKALATAAEVRPATPPAVASPAAIDSPITALSLWIYL